MKQLWIDHYSGWYLLKEEGSVKAIAICQTSDHETRDRMKRIVREREELITKREEICQE